MPEYRGVEYEIEERSYPGAPWYRPRYTLTIDGEEALSNADEIDLKLACGVPLSDEINGNRVLRQLAHAYINGKENYQ